MQSSRTITPITHPQHIHRDIKSWKHRVNKNGNKVKKVTQYGIVAMA